MKRLLSGAVLLLLVCSCESPSGTDTVGAPGDSTGIDSQDESFGSLNCTAGNVGPCGCDSVVFETQVKPILAEKCMICHGTADKMDPFAPDLDWTREPVVAYMAPQVRDRITQPAGSPTRMPKQGELSPNELKTMLTWIAQQGLSPCPAP